MNAKTGRNIFSGPDDPCTAVSSHGRARFGGVLFCAVFLICGCDRNSKSADAPEATATTAAPTDDTAGAIAAASSFYDDRHGVLYESGFGGDCKLTGFMAGNPTVAGDKPLLRVFPSRTISPSRTAYSIEIAPSYLPGSFALLSEDQAHEWIAILNHAAAATLPSGHSLSSADVRGTMQDLYFTINVGSSDVLLKFVNGNGFFGSANSDELKQALKAALKGLADLKNTASSMTW